MDVFHADLDNTLIFSYRHDIGQEKRCVEVYQGREISFITEKTHRLLREINEKMLVVPTTTRTREQYERITLGVGELPFALVCNGGVLLINGKKDPEWYAHSLELIAGCRREMEKAAALLEQDPGREMEVRYIEELFLFTKCADPGKTVRTLQRELDTTALDVLHNGTKVYVLPKELRKGKALQRFREYKKAQRVFAAGDSAFDVSMLEAADWAAAPDALLKTYRLPGHVAGMPGRAVYSEEVLEAILTNME